MRISIEALALPGQLLHGAFLPFGFLHLGLEFGIFGLQGLQSPFGVVKAFQERSQPWINHARSRGDKNVGGGLFSVLIPFHDGVTFLGGHLSGGEP